MVQAPIKHLGLYVHTPFCLSKCRYCDFASWSNKRELESPYIKTLLKEIKYRSDEANSPADSVFFGGGTPSLLPIESLEAILSALDKAFTLSKDTEISIEANPGTVSLDYLKALKALGFNRISFGVQAMQSHLLKILGRIHSAHDAVLSLVQAYKAGFDNINADLMFGIPTQSLKDVKESIETLSALPISHLSCYGLIVEDGTPIKKDIDKGLLHLPDTEYERQMYYEAKEMLHKKGIMQYEVSNFAYKGKECRHNLGTWHRELYLGFGSSSASLIRPNLRRSNPPNIEDYIAGKSPEFTEISESDQMFEYIMLGLRLVKGIDIRDFNMRFNRDFIKTYGEKLKPSINKRLIHMDNTHVRLTEKGFDLMNSVLLDIME
ncbi:MAG: radical SAM family heme chaperone HemW [Eubacteriales bacterium]|nr:radical SAM family heme chaperone HemW [Eubacteriales bacterium]